MSNEASSEKILVKPKISILNRIDLWSNLVLLILIIFFTFPFLWVVTSAFRKYPHFYIEFKDFTLRNVQSILTGRTLMWIENSLILAIGTAIIAVSVCFLGAYVLSKCHFKGKNILMFVMILSMCIPLSAVMLPTYSMIRKMGLVNTRIGVILVLAARFIPMGVWVIKEFIDGIPKELEEAARIDGAGTLTLISKITFPLALPGTAVIALIAFLGGWGDFTLNLILINKEKLYPISLGIFKASLIMTGSRAAQVVQIDHGIMAAISMLYLIIPVIFFILMQKHLVKGMVIGAVKG